MSLYGSLALKLEQNGARCAYGQAAITGSATITTGLRTVDQVLTSLEDPPSLTAMWPRGTPNATDGDIDIAVLKPTGAADVTPIAATSGVGVYWLAIGT